MTEETARISSSIGRRPATLRAMPPYGDLLVCGVSTQLHHEVVGFDDPIRPSDTDFAASGLKAPSLIRLGFLAVLPASTLLGAIGSIEKVRHLRLLERLSNHLRSATTATEATPGAS